MRHFPGSFVLPQFTAGGAQLALARGLQRDLLLWDMDRDRPARAPLSVPGNPYALTLSPDDRWLACGGRQRRLMIYDLRGPVACGLAGIPHGFALLSFSGGIRGKHL